MWSALVTGPIPNTPHTPPHRQIACIPVALATIYHPHCWPGWTASASTGFQGQVCIHCFSNGYKIAVFYACRQRGSDWRASARALMALNKWIMAVSPSQFENLMITVSMQVLVICWKIAFHFYKVDPIFHQSIARLMEAKAHIK